LNLPKNKKYLRKGCAVLIKFDKLWETMKNKKISTYQLRESCGIDSKTIRRLKANENIETKTLNKLCSALNCRLEDIAEYVKDAPNTKAL
jgi:putative transcriptional regulator